MAEPQPVDRFQPSFFRFPIQNNRTGWQPVSLPVVLVVPFSHNSDGSPIQGSEIKELTFGIEETIGTRVAGHVNIGLFVPPFALLTNEISTAQLQEVKIDPSDYQFFDPEGNEKDFEDAVEKIQIQDW